MTRHHAFRPVALAFAGALMTAACAPLDTIAQPAGTRSSTMVQGEVRSIDSRRGAMQVREDRGRTFSVRLDNRTQVTSGSRRLPLSYVERGDHVRVRVAYDRSGTAWADRIEVREGRRDGRGWPGDVGARTERVSGRVASVDTRRGFFTLEQSRSRMVIQVPQRLSNADARRFDRLRRGDRVTVDVRVHGRNQVELVRFR
jgi:hypothetical protein